MSVESPGLSFRFAHFQVPNQQVITMTAAAVKGHELMNSWKNESNEPSNPPTHRSFLNSPMPIQTSDFGSISLECNEWFVSIHRPNLTNEENRFVSAVSTRKNIMSVSLTLMDPSVEQLASRLSSVFQRRACTLPYLIEVSYWFCWLIYSVTWWSKLFKGSDWPNWQILIVLSSEQEAKTSAEIQVTSQIRSEWKWKTWSAVCSSESQTVALCR